MGRGGHFSHISIAFIFHKCVQTLDNLLKRRLNQKFGRNLGDNDEGVIAIMLVFVITDLLATLHTDSMVAFILATKLDTWHISSKNT